MLKEFVKACVPDSVRSVVEKPYYLRQLRNGQGKEESRDGEFRVIHRLVRPGDTVIDVGANVGVYTAYLSSLVAGGSVYSLEPVPRTYEILRNNVSRMPLRNVRAFNFGASDREGRATIYVPRGNYYQATLAKRNFNVTRSISVELKPLDLFTENPTFIKIDVERHELEVIRGARRLLERCHPALMIEVCRNEFDTLTRELAGYGYAPYWYDGQDLRPADGKRDMNYFYLTRPLGSTAREEKCGPQV